MSPTNEAPCLDAARIDELTELLGDDQILLTLFEEFFADLPPRLEKMHEGLQARRAELIDVAAHAVRGSSANLGASEVAKLATRLERTAQEQEFEPVGRLLAQLEAEICRLQKRLHTSGLR